MSTVVSILRRFNLDKIPQNWTSEIWNSQFTDNSPISDYESRQNNIEYKNNMIIFKYTFILDFASWYCKLIYIDIIFQFNRTDRRRGFF